MIAGTGGIASNIGFNDQNSVTDAQLASGPGAIEFLDRTNCQVGVVADRPGDDHLARRVIPYGLVAAGTCELNSAFAREYGLPAVVGVEQATRLIRDRKRVLINGTDGYVEILP